MIRIRRKRQNSSMVLNLNITLFTEHGPKKEIAEKWVDSSVNNNWKDNFIPIFQNFTDRTPEHF